MLQDSPLSSAQPLHQVAMMSLIPCPCSPSSPLFTKWGSCTGCMRCHPASCLVCPLVCPLHYPVALYSIGACNVIQPKLSSFASYLSSLLFSYLVLGACYVIQPVGLFLSCVQHTLSLPLLWLLPVKQERDFNMNIYIYKCTFYNIVILLCF